MICIIHMGTNHFDTFKHVTSSTLRAIAGKKDLEASYHAGEAPIGTVGSLNAPRLPLPDHGLSAESVQLVRGCADAHAFKIAYHNQDLHERLAPEETKSRAAFDALEQARVEALGIHSMAGSQSNLSAVLDEKCCRRGYLNATSRDQIPLPDALHALMRLHLSGEPGNDAQQNIQNLWAPWIEETLGTSLQDYCKNTPASLLSSQKDFAAFANRFLSDLNMTVKMRDGSDTAPDDNGDPPPDDRENEEQDASQDSQTEPDESPDQSDASMDDTTDSASDEQDENFDAGYEDIMDDLAGQDDAGNANLPPDIHNRPPEDFIHGPEGAYLIYTTKYDEEINARNLADSFELTRLREKLDKQLASHQTIITKLANRLQRKLMAKQMRSWQFDMEEGILDVTRLARVIADPNVPVTYKKEQQTEFRDTLVTILIDNSGSMRGRPIAIAAMTTDILARTLERCGVKVEILGFTTRAWKGGKSRDLWMQNGRPDHPGRLNDIRHIIYKGADDPWRRTRKNIALMLKEGVLKENIDGEALVWAYNRLAPRPEARKIMMVISDGAPVDDSTLSVNPANILEADLRTVIKWLESRKNIELAAIGIGHDVTRYYSKSLTIQDVENLAPALTKQLETLFDDI